MMRVSELKKTESAVFTVQVTQVLGADYKSLLDAVDEFVKPRKGN
jgi:hypothetical protein